MVRRVETIKLGPEPYAHRHLSLDFQAWDFPKDVAGRRLVPLVFLEKANLLSFDISDERGTALPISGREFNWQLGQQMLFELAAAALNTTSSQLPEELQTDLKTIVMGNAETGLEVLRKFKESVTSSEGDESPTKKIWSATSDGLLLSWFATSFLLVVHLDAAAGERRIVKIDHAPVFRKRVIRGLLRRLVWLLGFSHETIYLEGIGVHVAATNHFEVTPPAGLKLAGFRLVAAQASAIANDSEYPYLAHLRWPPLDGAAGPLPEGELRLEVDLCLDTAPAMIQSLLSAGFVFLILAGGLVLRVGVTLGRWPNPLPAAQVAGAVLLVVPAALSLAGLTQEHPLVRRRLTPVRTQLVISGLVAFAAAVSLALEPFPTQHRFWLWAGLELVAAGNLGWTLGLWWFSRRAPRQR